MGVDRSSRVDELFHAALELPPDRRSDFLLQTCDDDDVRAEVRSLLAADAAAEAFLSSPLRSEEIIEADLPPDAMIGRRIGRYTLRRLIGSGGMGVVYEALQEQPRRSVALKLMRVGFAGTKRASRLAREAELLARLQHPGIAQIYDAGVHDEAGVAIPFLVMEHVAEACDILTYAGRCGLDRRGRLELLARVCDAVEHGHQRGVIHRDLKPGNVLVDATGQPKVIDFGVARLTDLESGATTYRTETGELVGTLRY
ncbi:MAG: serine/threonine protein kinase, partial [Phycisphaerales bacterium]